MGQLDHLVSEQTPVTSKVHANAGDVLVLLRNGRPVRGLRGGKVFRPG